MNPAAMMIINPGQEIVKVGDRTSDPFPVLKSCTLPIAPTGIGSSFSQVVWESCGQWLGFSLLLTDRPSIQGLQSPRENSSPAV